MKEKRDRLASHFKVFPLSFKKFKNKKTIFKFCCALSFLLSFIFFSFSFRSTASSQKRAFAMDVVTFSHKNDCTNVYLESDSFSAGDTEDVEHVELWESAYQTNFFNTSKSLSFFQILFDSKIEISLSGFSEEVSFLDWSNYDAEHTEGDWFGGIAVNKAVDSVWFPPYFEGKTNTVYLSKLLADDLLKRIEGVSSYADLCGKSATINFGGSEISLKIANVIAEGDGFGGALGYLFERFVVFDFWNSKIPNKGAFNFKKLLLTKNDYSVIKTEISKYGETSFSDFSLERAGVFNEANSMNWYLGGKGSLDFIDSSNGSNFFFLIPSAVFFFLPFSLLIVKGIEFKGLLFSLMIASLFFSVFCGLYFLVSFYFLKSVFSYFTILSIPCSVFYSASFVTSFLGFFIIGRKND